MTTLSDDRRSDTPLWRPDRARVEAAPLTRFAAHVADRKGLRFGDYEALWRWSVDELEAFWSEIVAFSTFVSTHPRVRCCPPAPNPVRAGSKGRR